MKKEQGITLVALIVTIIVLIILAAVTLRALTGEHGILGNAKTAKVETEYASAKELVKLELSYIQTKCIRLNKKYNLVEIAQGMKESEDITIEKYYNDDIASIKDGVTENLISLKAIVVSVNEYPRYKFLIEEPGKITKVLSEEIKDTTEITDFKEIEEFEKKIMDKTDEGEKEEEKILVSTDVLKDVNKFEETINDKEKLEYIIDHPETFIDPITQDKDIGSTLLKNEDAVDLIIGNDEWRDKILEDDSTQILDNSGAVNLPTTNLQIYNPTTGMGNVLVSAYLRNDNIHSPINAFIGGTPGQSDWESPNLPAYIGCDFGEGNEVWVYKVYTKPGNNTAPTKMYLECSNDNVTWERVYEFTKYTTPENETTEVIRSDKNNKKARYWRLYITESINKSYVDLLKIQFYGK